MAHYRTLFISDLHLGARGAQAERVLAFLRANTCDRLFLVGDVIDFWALSRKSFFPQAHRDVLAHIWKLAAAGTPVTYLVGNHDEALRHFIPVSLPGLTILDEAVFVTATGKRYLVVHGDRFDNVMENARWLAYIGDVAYTLALRANAFVNGVRRHLGLKRWSFSAFLKRRVKSAVNFISSFEETLAKAAADLQCDGVICGHIHTAEDRQIGTTHYLNTGDWVESCTALAETVDGTLSVVHFDETSMPSARARAAVILPQRRAA